MTSRTRPMLLTHIAFLAATASVIARADRTGGGNWPSFRGPGATGVAEGPAPTMWDVDQGTNVKWKTAIPGLAHSSPIVWDDRLFVTSAVGSKSDPYLRVGLYGESPDHPEKFDHDFRVYCLDKNSGMRIG